MDIIVSHVNTDFDAFASMVAAKRLYPQAELVFPGSQEKKVRDFIESFKPATAMRLRDIKDKRIKMAVVVDTKSPRRLGKLRRLFDDPSVTVHLYDHHPHASGDLHGVVEVIEQVGATATIMTETLRTKGLVPTPMESTLLMLGIYEETGNLLFKGTTERDLRAAAYLLRHGASLKIVSTYMKSALSRDEVDLLNELLHDSTDIIAGGIKVRLAKASKDAYFGDAAHLAHKMMEMEDTDALVMLIRMEGKVVIIARSRAHELDVSKVLEEFGGGGHPTAASATVLEQPLELLEEAIKESIHRKIRPGNTASDIMTRPVITVAEGLSIKEAQSMMTRYGVNVLPALKDAEYRGIISREVVEKAIFHGFGKSTVADFMSTDALTATAETPQRAIEAMMIESNQRFMPVMDGSAIVGAITRTDLLRVMYEKYLKKVGVDATLSGTRTPSTKNLRTWLRDRFPAEVYDVFRAAGEIAQRQDTGAFLVGGTVRDLLMGQRSLDIDIVVEGDGIAFSRELALQLGAKVNVHERFKTAKVISGGLRIDVATARTEYYDSPAALPRVRMSSIKKDLYRRDFTINSLAVKLNPPNFGQLVDFFGGQRDIKDKVVRVLHNLSFIEDPTRAFRAIRFAERFGFKLSKQTESLIKSAIKMELFEKLSGTRLYDELELTFSETDPVSAVKKLSEYGLLGVIHPGLSLTEELEAVFASAHDTLLWFDLSFQVLRPEAASIYLMALVSGLSERQKDVVFETLSVPHKLKKAMLRDSRQGMEAIRRLPLRDPAALYEALKPLSLEAVLFAMAMASTEAQKKEISHYLLELRKVRPSINGHDLRRMGLEPGPTYAEILDRVLMEKLRGTLASRQDEETFVKEFIAKKP